MSASYRLIALATLILLAGHLSQAPTSASLQPPHVPMLAHYYIWFDPGSWGRAKADEPLLGRYSSDDPDVMRQHVRWAKDAGIDGFIVSWKATETLNRRLELLMGIAEEEDFRLAITYQGLDFEREPLTVSQVKNDLAIFRESYANSPVFQLFARPLVVLSGTPQFSKEQVAEIWDSLQGSVLLLASERSTDDYARLADVVDGNLYYWSSGDPTRDANYVARLNDFGRRVQESGGLWIAPAAPGFDARLVGGTRVVVRQDGEVLRRSISAAAQTMPDAIGIISWNEFSENTHIEPSKLYSDLYLNVIAGIQEATPMIVAVDSSDQGDSGQPYGLIGLVALGSVLVVSLGVLVVRNGKEEQDFQGSVQSIVTAPKSTAANEAVLTGESRSLLNLMVLGVLGGAIALWAFLRNRNHL